MLMIFPASEINGAFHANVLAYRLEYKNELINRDLTEKECLGIVYAIANDFINSRLLWLKSPVLNQMLNQAMVVHFPTWESERDCKQSEHFYRLVLDDVIVKIEQMMDMAIPEKSWNIWYSKQVGPDIIVEQGTDYRIMDWTRRMESGEWIPDETKVPVCETSRMLEQVSQVILNDLAKHERKTPRIRFPLLQPQIG